MSLPRVALATMPPDCPAGPDRDMPLLRRAVAEAGARVEVLPWDTDAEWQRFDLVVVRSTWDYTSRVPDFLAWADACAAVTGLANPAPVLRWNAHKGYLGELAAAGVPAVPTRYAGPGAVPELPEDGPYIVKPAWGAGGRLAARYEAGERDRALVHVGRLHAEGLDVMVQPYRRRIDVTGERSLVFVGGRFLHAMRKDPVLLPGVPYDVPRTAHPNLVPWNPTDAELTVARAALDVVPGGGRLLYARVDVVDDDEGRPQVMELELIEPNLFLAWHPDSLPVLARTIVRAAAGD